MDSHDNHILIFSTEKRIVKLILNDGLDCLQANSSEKFSRHQAFTVILRGKPLNLVHFYFRKFINISLSKLGNIKFLLLFVTAYSFDTI